MGCYPRRVNPDFIRKQPSAAVCCVESCLRQTKQKNSCCVTLTSVRKDQGDRSRPMRQCFKRNNQAATSNNAAWRADRDRAGAGHPEIDPHRRDGRSLPCPSHTSCTCDTERETQCRAREDESSVFLRTSSGLACGNEGECAERVQHAHRWG